MMEAQTRKFEIQSTITLLLVDFGFSFQLAKQFGFDYAPWEIAVVQDLVPEQWNQLTPYFEEIKKLVE